jgi:hypothetical protein
MVAEIMEMEEVKRAAEILAVEKVEKVAVVMAGSIDLGKNFDKRMMFLSFLC